jgi:2-keto-4-pentenoate hydratase/2-oxohepta-3-ene-1,7-dioic acid hydratase in catechol pathway
MPIVKPDARDPDVLHRLPLPGAFLTVDEAAEYRLDPGFQWMAISAETPALTFAGLREKGGGVQYVLVVESNPADDRLLVLPLPDGVTPLSVTSDPVLRTRWAERHRQAVAGVLEEGSLLDLSLRGVVEGRRLAPPIPTPGRVFAVAANFPSHLSEDLAISGPDAVTALSRARPRVFQKYPPLTPIKGGMPSAEFITGVIGPFDEMGYPARIKVPIAGDDGSPIDVETVVDYEAEIGVVLGYRLDWSGIRGKSDEDLMEAIAGVVLVSDAKARNPQVVGKIQQIDRPLPEVTDPYLTGNEALDRALGPWDADTCRWWGYAASWGNFAAIGPYFVSGPVGAPLLPRMLVSARSYGPAAVRDAGIPEDRDPGVFYLRQATVVTNERGYPDAMIWGVPDIIRSILAPDSALRDGDREMVLEPGDVIALGTPGGTVITSRPSALLETAEDVLFWWDPIDWHDAFFNRNKALYLRPGDEVFFWSEGLGCQRLVIRRMPALD